MQDWRNADRLANLFEAVAYVLVHVVGIEHSELPETAGGTTRGDHQDVVPQEFFDERQMVVILCNLRVIAPDDPDDTAQPALDNSLIQGSVGGPELPAEMIEHIFGCETGDERILLAGNLDATLIAIRVIVDRLGNDALGDIDRLFLFKLVVSCTGDFRLFACGDQLRMVAGRNLVEAGHDALNIDYHSLNGASNDSEFLVEVIARKRRALPHEHFIRRAADACHSNILGAFFLGERLHLRITGDLDDHFRKGWLVAVDEYVHGVFAKNAKIGRRAKRIGTAELDVGQVGRHHRTAPSVRQGGLDRMKERVVIIRVHPHVRHVKHFDDLAIDAPRHDFHLAPALLLLLGRALRQQEFSMLLSVLGETFQSHLGRNLVGVAAGGVHTEFLRKGNELHFVLNFVALGLSLRGHVEIVGDVAAVVGVGRRTYCRCPGDISRNDAVGIYAAGAQLCPLAEGVHPARAHVALLAAHAQLSEPAAGFLLVRAVEGGTDIIALRLLQHLQSCLVNGSFFHLTLLEKRSTGDCPGSLEKVWITCQLYQTHPVDSNPIRPSDPDGTMLPPASRPGKKARTLDDRGNHLLPFDRHDVHAPDPFYLPHLIY